MNPFAGKPAEEITGMWQARALRAADRKLRRILMCMFAHDYKDGVTVLLRATFPGFTDISRPIVFGYAMIVPSGRVVCDVIDEMGQCHATALYESESEFLTHTRALADDLKLADDDRKSMFDMLQRWVASDQRVDQNGRKLAS